MGMWPVLCMGARSEVGGASPSTVEGKWGGGWCRIWPWHGGDHPHSWGGTGVQGDTHPAAGQGGWGWQPCRDQGGQPHRLYCPTGIALAPPNALWGAAQPLAPGRQWGAHPAPDGGAAPSCVGSWRAPELGVSSQPPQPPAQALPSALTLGAALPANGGVAQPHCTPQPAWGCMAGPHPSLGVS